MFNIIYTQIESYIHEFLINERNKIHNYIWISLI